MAHLRPLHPLPDEDAAIALSLPPGGPLKAALSVASEQLV